MIQGFFSLWFIFCLHDKCVNFTNDFEPSPPPPLFFNLFIFILLKYLLLLLGFKLISYVETSTLLGADNTSLQDSKTEDDKHHKKGGDVSVLGASFLLWTDVAGVGALAAGYNIRFLHNFFYF